MKIFAFFAVQNSFADNCDSYDPKTYTAQVRCWDDCDLKYRDCLGEFDCEYSEWTCEGCNSSCTEDRKNYCWFSFQSCKYECPCGDGSQNVEVKNTTEGSIKVQTTCPDGCPCSNEANKKEFCEEKNYSFSILGNDSRMLDFKYSILPDRFESSFSWRNIEGREKTIQDFYVSLKRIYRGRPNVLAISVRMEQHIWSPHINLYHIVNPNKRPRRRVGIIGPFSILFIYITR